MNNILTRIINIASIVTTLGLIFSLGGYFGYRYSQSSNPSLNKNTLSDLEAKQSETVKIVAKEVIGIQFIKANQDRKCDENHIVKGTYNSDNGNYYVKSNKNYDRIKPDICFATEEFARDTAGFLKKF